MWNSLRTLGALWVALVLGVSTSVAGELTNVTLSRSQDFTVVTLYGDGPMSVTHQIVEAKDGKPHRIVVDVMGAVHKLPQNNFQELPAGSITTIRTSQFAVSPEPVVRIVLDLAHPAAYKLETPENEVRIMVSLPGDPPMEKMWSARDGDLPASPAETAPTFAQAEPSSNEAAASNEVASNAAASFAAADASSSEAAPEHASEGASTQTASEPSASDASSAASPEAQAEPAGASEENAASQAQPTSQDAAPAEQNAAPGWNNPAKNAEPTGPAKALPLAPAGAYAAGDNTLNAEPSASSAQPAESAEEQANGEAQSESTSAESESNEQYAASENAGASDAAKATPAAAASGAAMESSKSASAASNTHAHAHGSSELAQADSAPESESPAADNEAEAPEVPSPKEAVSQPDRVIDYNLPVPAAMAEGQSAHAQDGSNADTQEEETAQPKLAIKEPQASDDAQASGEAASNATSNSNATPTGSDAPATDIGSQPVASLTTLPPLSESAADLVPERTQVIYHTQGRRDPFKPLLQAGGYNAAALPDVSSLRLVGVLHDVKESWGLFEDANGFGYILRKGDRVKNGSLTQLSNNRAFFSITEFGWSRSVHLDLEPEG